MSVQDLRRLLEQKQGERNRVQVELRTAKRSVRELGRQIKASEEAQAILQQVAQLTQEELQFHISELVTLALNAVYGDLYTFKVEFVVRRGKTECDLFFEQDGHIIDPMTASGGGPVDIASFALRIALWNLSQPRSRNTIILDEPFRFLNENVRPQASALFKELSERLGLQIIYVTNEPDLAEAADKVFTVSQRQGVSKVQEG